MIGIFFWADNSCYPLILLARSLHFVPLPRCGVTATITAAVSFAYKV